MVMMSMNRCYSELIKHKTFKDRYEYLKLGGVVGMDTFGSARMINQKFYTSKKWRAVRDRIIIRDNGCDLGVEGFEIFDKIIIHHINPITIEDLISDRPIVYDPENLICTTLRTHNAIHFGDEYLLTPELVTRTPGDTKLW